MSAYMVSNEHIRVLVWKAGQREAQHATPFTFVRDNGKTLSITNAADAAEIGAILYDANAASLTARYGDPAPEEPYRHGRPQFPSWSALEAISALGGFEYQACEVENWPQTEAYRLCQELERHFVGLALLEAGVSTWTIDPHDLPMELAGAVV